MPLPERVPDDLCPLFSTIAGVYLPYLDANAAAYANGETRVRYQAAGAIFVEPVKLYRVWCRDRLQQRLIEFDDTARAEVVRIVGSAEALARLATPSPKPAENMIGVLPIRARTESPVVDSWWRK